MIFQGTVQFFFFFWKVMKRKRLLTDLGPPVKLRSPETTPGTSEALLGGFSQRSGLKREN